MKLVPMRFNNVSWHHNPKEIVFECSKNISEQGSPFGSSHIQNVGRKNMIIKGTGELYGSDCIEQFERLLNLFKKGENGVLAIPKMTPIFAVFESIKIIGEPKENVLTYGFVFREVMEDKHIDVTKSYVAQNETLWDISFKFSVDIDRLVGLNSQLKRPDEILFGEEIRLC